MKLTEMPSRDITFCDNHACPLRHDCWRFRGHDNDPLGWYRSVTTFEPEVLIGGEIMCDWKIKVESR